MRSLVAPAWKISRLALDPSVLQVGVSEWSEDATGRNARLTLKSEEVVFAAKSTDASKLLFAARRPLPSVCYAE